VKEYGPAAITVLINLVSGNQHWKSTLTKLIMPIACSIDKYTFFSNTAGVAIYSSQITHELCKLHVSSMLDMFLIISSLLLLSNGNKLALAINLIQSNSIRSNSCDNMLRIFSLPTSSEQPKILANKTVIVLFYFLRI
jgi:hypothetical protein